MFRKAVKGLGAAAIGAGGYQYGLKQAEADVHTATALKAKSQNGPVTVYQFPPSAPCQKVLAYLEVQKVPHQVVDVSPLTKKELIFSESYKKVPVAFVDGQQVNDSSVILKELSKKYGGSYDEAAMRYIDEHVYPAVAATAWENPAQAYATQSLFWRAALTVATPLFRRKYEGEFGDRLDSTRLLPVLEEAFKRTRGGMFSSGVTASEAALYGILRTQYHLEAVQEAVAAAGKTKWFTDLDERAKANAQKLREEENAKPKSKCPFAKNH